MLRKTVKISNRILSRCIHEATSAEIIRKFKANPALHFDNAKQFKSSKLFSQLDLPDCKVMPAGNPVIQTNSMLSTLKYLGLESCYRVIPNHFYLGFHGTGACSMSALTPQLQPIKPMDTYHNGVFRGIFYVGDNVNMAVHYANLNSIQLENIDENSDPHFYPAQIGMLVFAKQEVIHSINSGKISVTATLASVKKSYQTMPDDHHIGYEIRIPTEYHGSLSTLPVFRIQGTRRLTPLDAGSFFYRGKLCDWKKGEGLKEVDVTSMIQKSYSN